MNTWDFSKLVEDQQQSRRAYLEFLRVPSMSMGVYCLPAGSVDPQQPHQEDEVYYIVSGHGQFLMADQSLQVEPGTLLFVPAQVEHRFHSIVEDLQILVFFAPAETNL